MQLEASLIASSDFTSGCDSSKNSIAVAASSYLSSLKHLHQKPILDVRKPTFGGRIGMIFGVLVLRHHSFPNLFAIFQQICQFWIFAIPKDMLHSSLSNNSTKHRKLYILLKIYYY